MIILGLLSGFLIAIGAAILVAAILGVANWLIMGVAYLIEICFKGIH